MSDRILDDRRVALEEAFFRKENERLLLQMRIQRELASVTDADERARRIEAIKAEIAVKREEALNSGEVLVIEPGKS